MLVGGVKMVWKNSPKIVTEIKEDSKIDLNIIKKKSSGKTPKGIVLGYLKKLKDSEAPFEYLKVLENLYKEIANLETSEKFRAKQWRGKSGVKYLTYPDKIISIRYKREDIGEIPKEIRIEILKEEINKVIWAINKLERNELKTSEIAELVYGKNWKDVFSTRPEHIKLVEILNFLEYKNWIHYYRSGKIKILNKIEEQKNL